jgi:1-deoxy-D-xylulose-5-phosphate reductoisomerase
MTRYPCLRLAYEAIQVGGTASVILNAANEVAVEAFLAERLAFIDIPRVVDETLQRMPVERVEDLDALLAVDCQGRAIAEQVVQKRVLSSGIG